MLMVAIMLGIWQGTNDSKYQEPFKKTVEASYSGSELKSGVDRTLDTLRDKAPTIAKLGPAAYVIVVKKKAQFTSTKLSAFPNTVSTYKYENNTGTISITWSF